MTTDRNICLQIEQSLAQNAQLKDAKISVSVQDGEAILTGFVDKYCKKEIVKKIAKDIEGVTHVVESIEVNLSPDQIVADEIILTEIDDKFKKNFGNAHKDIRVVVTNGNVRLDGVLKWKYQKELATECIACIGGIKTIENHIVIPETILPALDEKDILAAIYGDHSITTDIKVEVIGNRVILKGSVENINQKNLVARLVRNVPGVAEIENFLNIDWMSSHER